LYARNIPKAWVRIGVSASPGNITITGTDGFFILSVEFVTLPSFKAVRVTLKSAMAELPCATATMDFDPDTINTPRGRYATVHAVASNMIDIYFWEESGGFFTVVDPEALPEALSVNLHVHGAQ